MRRFYSGNYEENHLATSNEIGPQFGGVKKIHYISGGDGICAIYVESLNDEDPEPKDSIFYVYKDYLGSLLTFTDEKGEVVFEQNFDAWGRHRNIKDWSYVDIQHRPVWMYRGYTGHEHLGFENGLDGAHKAFYLINMNGRLYDPIKGRMLSPDNFAHDGAGAQGYNRYSYAHNNPLKYTDPDGEIAQLAVMAIGAGISVIMNGIGNMQNHQNFWKGAGVAAFKGFVFGGLSCGIGTAFAGVHGAWLFQAGAHGILGGISSAGSGGKFWAGFASGAISSVVGSAITPSKQVVDAMTKGQLVGLQIAQILGGGLSGGIGSSLAGGSFTDGVKNGLISAGLNHAMHNVANGIEGYLGDPEKASYRIKMSMVDAITGKETFSHDWIITMESVSTDNGLVYKVTSVTQVGTNLKDAMVLGFGYSDITSNVLPLASELGNENFKLSYSLTHETPGSKLSAGFAVDLQIKASNTMVYPVEYGNGLPWRPLQYNLNNYQFYTQWKPNVNVIFSKGK
jgi:RHS repeat-associated protein